MNETMSGKAINVEWIFSYEVTFIFPLNSKKRNKKQYPLLYMRQKVNLLEWAAVWKVLRFVFMCHIACIKRKFPQIAKQNSQF